MSQIKDRFKHAWNAFMNKDPTEKVVTQEAGYSYFYSSRPDIVKVSYGNEKSILNSIMCRIAVDCASIDIHHVKLDEYERYSETIHDSLDTCLTIEANIDQTGRQLINDIVLSMLDEGVVAVVPIDTNIDPTKGTFTVETLRVGKIVEWRPSSVKVRAYNDRNGKKEEIWCLKQNTAIIENPFYSIMNDKSSTAKRLSRKLSLLDSVDEKRNSNKLNMIIQLPYSAKNEMKKKYAEERVENLEAQLQSSPHGIAYSDATEKIIQLNRPLENELMGEVEYLTNQLYQQLTMTPGILDGTADEKTMNNYYSRTVEPIMNYIVEEFKRKFLSKTARSQGQSIMYFRDPFKLAPISSVAELADKFTRNTIMTANEIRQAIGMRPSQDPRADELKNANISESKDQEHINVNGQNIGQEMEDEPEAYPVEY